MLGTGHSIPATAPRLELLLGRKREVAPGQNLQQDTATSLVIRIRADSSHTTFFSTPPLPSPRAPRRPAMAENPYAPFIAASEDTDGVRFSWNVLPTNRLEATRMASAGETVARCHLLLTLLLSCPLSLCRLCRCRAC